MKRIPPSVRMKKEVEQLLRGEAVEGAAAETPMRGFVRSLAQYILQVSIEEEATTFLGREHYRRGGRLRMGWKRLRAESSAERSGVDEIGGPTAASNRGAVSPQAGGAFGQSERGSGRVGTRNVRAGAFGSGH